MSNPDIKEREAKRLAKYRANVSRMMAPLVCRERFRNALMEIAAAQPTTVAKLKEIAREALKDES